MENFKSMKIDQEFLEELYWEDDFDFLPIKGLQREKRRQGKIIKSSSQNLTSTEKSLLETLNQADDLREYGFSYNASLYESSWLLDSLGLFYEDQWISDVLNLIKGGKEASVYLCEANPSTSIDLIAAKVYRPRMFRNLKNDHTYREGRDRLDSDGLEIVDERMGKAIQGRTDYGLRLLHTSWIEHEFRTMKILHQAGCDVPNPLTSGYNTILMSFIGDRRLAAPTLNNIRLDRQEAKILFQRVIHNIELMLAHERVHGDLSAYNLLYWNGEITLIDFPQAINPYCNPHAYPIFKRDVQHICEYFARQGVLSEPSELADKLWISQDLRSESLYPIEFYDYPFNEDST